MEDFDFLRDYDAFLEEAHEFEEDVHVLVLCTFDAAQAHWSGRLDEELRSRLRTASMLTTWWTSILTNSLGILNRYRDD
jgi:hypothetical protein